MKISEMTEPQINELRMRCWEALKAILPEGEGCVPIFGITDNSLHWIIGSPVEPAETARIFQKLADLESALAEQIESSKLKNQSLWSKQP